MTIERPMLPPRGESVDSSSRQPATEQLPAGTPPGDSATAAERPSAAIIDFQAIRAVVTAKPAKPQTSVLDDDDTGITYRPRRPAPEPTTETGRNQRLRADLQEGWRKAVARTDYCHRIMEFESAIHRCQDLGLPEGKDHPAIDYGYLRLSRIKAWRKALVQQLLTPAPDNRAVTWKEATLKQGQHEHIGVDVAELERAIAKDKAWLAAHPSRAPDPEKTANRRAFRETMRRRILEVAAARNLSPSDIKPVLGLRHKNVADFASQYGISLAWLYEGTGSMFRTAEGQS